MPGDYLASWNHALQQQHTAEHLLEVTFPLSKDPKLLLGIIYNLSSSIHLALDALFLKEGIIPKPELNQKISDLKMKSKHYGEISSEEIKFMLKIEEIKESHQNSPVEFKRNKKLVICDKEYGMQVLTVSEVKEHLQQLKSFLNHIHIIIERK